MCKILASRIQNRETAMNGYEQEQEEVLGEIKSNPVSEKYKKAKIKEFWDKTFNIYGKDILKQRGIIAFGKFIYS